MKSSQPEQGFSVIGTRHFAMQVARFSLANQTFCERTVVHQLEKTRMQTGVPKISIVLIVLLSLAQVGCGSARSVQSQCNSVGYEFFYDSARSQREFANFPLEKKYDVMICAGHGIHPPRLEFASLFATEGARGATLLQEHLRKSTDDLTVRDIGYALLMMQELGTYNVLADKRLMELLELRVKGMKDEGWRGVSLEHLKRLRVP